MIEPSIHRCRPRPPPLPVTAQHPTKSCPRAHHRLIRRHCLDQRPLTAIVSLLALLLPHLLPSSTSPLPYLPPLLRSHARGVLAVVVDLLGQGMSLLSAPDMAPVPWTRSASPWSSTSRSRACRHHPPPTRRL
ncbi:Os04g0209600 [Oryza sativa Japonica Group]|uniref:Os04g0209600 protein n=1 Tax=Oryza sativa subsp. japonica TaxID=39947 RepID=A0A0P0W7G9_ORYSJ|nr:Os04g0209600 [Oryza sativa Japonica Group]